MMVDDKRYDFCVALLAMCLLTSFGAMAQNVAGLRIRCAGGLQGNVAVSIADANVVKPDTAGGNIVSELLLSSELRGRVEHPLDYFRGDNRARHDMDLLMLTQGWRRYPIDSVLNGNIRTPEDSFETDQSISGEVKSVTGGLKDVRLEMLVSKTMERKTFDIGKIFIIDGLDFVDGTTFTLQAVGKRSQSRTLQLRINPIAFPLVRLEAEGIRESSVDIPNAFYVQSVNSLNYNRSLNAYELPGVEIAARRFRPKNLRGFDDVKGFGIDDPVFEKSPTMAQLVARLGVGITFGTVGKPGVDSRHQRDENEEDNDNLDNMTVPRIIVFEKDKFGAVMKYVPVKVYLNDQLLTDGSELQGITDMDPLDIKQIEATRDGTEMFVYTKDGKEPSRFRLHKPLSVVTVRQLGYKPPVEFYVPGYNAVADGLKMDKRTTLYWNPSVRLDGESVIGFVPSDVSKSVLVTVEGVADDGTVIHEQTILKQ